MSMCLIHTCTAMRTRANNIFHLLEATPIYCLKSRQDKIRINFNHKIITLLTN